ncbi:MAG: ATP-dependent DNA helicase [Clostridiales bacterium]|mgnify:CR=1 FL=1|nr:ATP-dependent DNA helicase [Clostridiales bacterium]MDO4349772.1 ATP-dependent DNA helicase [Eubacteriales bacterium]MDY4008066.1 ATP-dependent DNA helicase [Candidatus Limiplasma sp.]
MEETFRVSVRELVAFSYFPEDILPAADMESMLIGSQAHRARQATSQDEAERTIKHAFHCGETEITLYGRMDLFRDGDIPLVEEIKLGAGDAAAPLAEHRAQAVCYAAMLALEKPCGAVRICVAYVSEMGEVRQRFEETLAREGLVAEVEGLLGPYAAFARREARHRRMRDDSLKALPFPFPSYRQGQRELAVQVYTAIDRKRRLFASLPTGTGKSAAVLYPALKALGEGKTGKVAYLTARNTARQSPLNALERFYAAGMHARCMVLTAKETLCPAPTRCHPDFCPRAKGHYVRQGRAVEELLKENETWTDERILRAAEAHALCPFELALALSELADVILMDLNYAFDPFAQLKRLFQGRRNMTLLVDEAHHTVERVRESLSGTLDSRVLATLRAEYGKALGRANAYYRALTALIRQLRALEKERENGETVLDTLPEGLLAHVEAVRDEAFHTLTRGGGMTSGAAEAVRLCLPFLYAAQHLDKDYAILLERRGRERTLTLYCLLPGKEIAAVTKGLRGVIFFSATLSPLPAMKRLLGGGEEDACFSLPSPFPREHLAVVRKRVCTRYTQREESAKRVARAICEAVQARPGSYIAYFPSYAYLELVRGHLEGDGLPTLWVQRREMGEEERAAFLNAFMEPGGARLGLCVLGGLFSEGVDLPGSRLIGAMIIGVGLPMPSARMSAVQACYHRCFGDGYAYACRFPAMHKVLQAAGRVIRSEADKGMVLLLDDRYYQPEYEALLPPEWQLYDEDIALAAKRLEEAP